MLVNARVPLKVILSGEHAVLRGYPCVAMACDLHVSSTAKTGSGYISPTLYHGTQAVELTQCMRRAIEVLADEVWNRFHKRLNMLVESVIIHVPENTLGRGLGSSASILVSLIAVYFVLMAKVAGSEMPRLDDIIMMATRAEHEIHGRSSGIDVRTVTYGGFVVLNSSVKRLPKDILTKLGIKLVILDSMQPKSTKKAITTASSHRNYESILANIGKVTTLLINELLMEEGSTSRIHAFIKENQSYLAELGLMTPELIRTLETLSFCRSSKIIGAGLGGFCIGLYEGETYPGDMQAMGPRKINTSNGLEVSIDSIRIDLV
ncbi:Mevalonate kinase [Giardia muris]|uniref:Mevalonate kinase n=1 Tax=Giardia muris TaxID=5742 RepID=A0A4Z1SSP6_GIAMU|nr:Mevalonate kinase [Giardia muris]|eukprot:TNJ28942.1 Mevalonate kinase [Giardia muris]